MMRCADPRAQLRKPRPEFHVKRQLALFQHLRFGKRIAGSANALIKAHAREVVAAWHHGLGRRAQHRAQLDRAAGHQRLLAPDAHAHAERPLGNVLALMLHARKPDDGAAALRRLPVEAFHEAFQIVGAVPFQHVLGHDVRPELGGKEARAHAKQDACEQEGGQVRPRQHAQRQRRDEDPQRKREIRLVEQFEINANAGAEKYRQPQKPAPLLGVKLRRKRPACTPRGTK